MKKQKLIDLNIEVVEPREHYRHPPVYHSALPQHEFSMLIVAPKGSGKTNLLCNLILKHYRKYFHRILVCSPTVMNDDKWSVVKDQRHLLMKNERLEKILTSIDRNHTQPKEPIKKVVHENGLSLEKQLRMKETGSMDKFIGKIPADDFFTDLSDVLVKIKEQQDIIQKLHDKGFDKEAKYIADRLLVVLDDQAGMFKGGNTNNPLMNYIIKHRHVSSSVIIVTQAYRAIPKTIRTNCNAIILFDIPNKNELRSIYEENPEGLTEKEWMRVYNYATEENYSFLYINNKFTKGQRIFKRFDKLLKIEMKHGSRFDSFDTSSDDDDDDDNEEEETVVGRRTNKLKKT